MKAIYDEASANEVHREEQGIKEWERAEKNRILGMSNVQKKQLAWNALFPQPIYSEEINSMVF